MNRYTTYTEKTKTMQSWFYRKLNFNPNGNKWYVIRENGVELKVNTNYSLKSNNDKNPRLRNYEHKFFINIIKNGI